MAQRHSKMQAIAFCALLAAPIAYAQATDNLPDLSTVIDTKTVSTTSSSSAATSSATTTTSAGTSSAATTRTSVAGVITDAPDIGAGIPTLIVPFTANAPFMQKSTLPEGTVFIAVGGVLAFLGLLVVLWRGLVAWSVNRSVRRAALASLGGKNEKRRTLAHRGYSQSGKTGLLAEYDVGSSMSLDALTTAGKHIKEQNHRQTSQSPAPAGLFFSPTAQAQTGRNSPSNFDQRLSTHLPAGYYASPSADRPAGGAGTATIGSSLAPYARHSIATPSPPRSPELPPASRQSTATYYKTPTSRDGLRPGDSGARASSSRDRLSRDGYGPSTTTRASAIYAQPSTSSLMVGTGGAAARQSTDHLGGSRAPSAFLDDLFDASGTGQRERF